MYLRILKKDLKRKRTMNVILLLFITLASMFVASSVNNIISVTTALDRYFDMANAPDYFGSTMNKAGKKEIKSLLDEAEAIKSYRTEKVIYMGDDMISYHRAGTEIISGTLLFQGDDDLALNYFLADNSILRDVAPGEVYLTEKSMKAANLSEGDLITITMEGIRKEFRIAGGIKDAVLGSNGLNITRYIVDASAFNEFYEKEEISDLFGGECCYIETDDVDAMKEQLGEDMSIFIFSLDRAYMRLCYAFDMIVTGILLAVSVLLIVISFVVLRFTITFTLSEEFREIGVMKAIGIKNSKIRSLYLIKYAILAVVGAFIGLILSYPFGKLLMKISSKNVIVTGEHADLMNVLCSVGVVTVILLFSYGCTKRVTGFTPVDAIRNGQTGERFRKKSLMSLGKSKLGTTVFLATNDIVSSPKRFGIVTVTFSLCLSITLMLSATASTLKSRKLLSAFALTECHAMVNIGGGDIMSFLIEDGRTVLREYLADMEEELERHGISAVCVQDLMATFTVRNGKYEKQIPCFQATGAGADQFTYIEGTAPESPGEIAITRLAAREIKADIGDVVTMVTMEGERELIITAIFQTMNHRGLAIRFHEDEEFNYIQMMGGSSPQIIFTDHPNRKEVEQRVEKMNTFFGDYGEVETAADWIGKSVGVAEAMDAIKGLMTGLTVLLVGLVTVLMERSFIAKETCEIALMKAVGFRKEKIYAYHTARFAIVGSVAVLLSELLFRPLLRLCIDPIFKMMGMELAVEYDVNRWEVYVLLPVIVLGTTVLTAFLTALYTRKIKTVDVVGQE